LENNVYVIKMTQDEDTQKLSERGVNPFMVFIYIHIIFTIIVIVLLTKRWNNLPDNIKFICVFLCIPSFAIIGPLLSIILLSYY